MRCKYTWKNESESAAVISIAEITKDDKIPWKTGDRLVAKYDEEKGLLIMKSEAKF